MRGARDGTCASPLDCTLHFFLFLTHLVHSDFPLLFSFPFLIAPCRQDAIVISLYSSLDCTLSVRARQINTKRKTENRNTRFLSNIQKECPPPLFFLPPLPRRRLLRPLPPSPPLSPRQPMDPLHREQQRQEYQQHQHRMDLLG